MKMIIKWCIFAISMLVFVNQANASVELQIANGTGYVGDVIQVAVNSPATLTGNNVYSFQLEISYNATYMEPTGATLAGTVSSGWGNLQFNANAGNLRITAAGTQPLAGTGSIVLISVKLLRAGNIPVNFINTGFTMLNEGNPSLVLKNGTITSVARPTITVSPQQGTVAIGQTLQFSSYNGTAPYSYSVTDATVASINSSGLLTGLKRGVIKVVSVDQAGIRDTTDSYIEVVPFKLTIRDSTYYQNNWVNIPVNISPVNVEQVKSGQVTLTFNSSVLTAESVIKAGTLLSSATIETDVSTPGRLTMSFAQTSNLAGSGVLFFVRFKVANQPSGATYISFNSAVFNEVLYSVYDNGYFSIKPLPPLTVTPQTGLLYPTEQLNMGVSGGTAPYQWSVSDPTVASINASGQLTALKGGDVVVSVTDFYGSSGKTGTISVYDAKLTIAEVTAPANSSMVELPVTLTSPVTQNILSFSGEITFTPTKIASFDLKRTGTMSENWSVAKNSNSNLFRFAMAGTQAVSNSMVVVLQASLGTQIAYGNVIPVEISQALANEGTPRLLVDQGKITITQATAIDDATIDNLSVYQDATTQCIYFKSFIPVFRVSLYDLTGSLIKTELYTGTDKGSLKTNDLAKGIYIIRLETTDNRSTVKKITIR